MHTFKKIVGSFMYANKEERKLSQAAVVHKFASRDVGGTAAPRKSFKTFDFVFFPFEM